ncbi:unnamed protein product (macronuclear) [Paramecium tetraurelia]|uniref:Mei2-like C-terminal RNA recognition motif domain-containing protein n=1 Tax=Paramecium tetraurelia TaxID=5888 RepID=A0DYN4_PARTE|nr:uncharacterized protein GSPATT00003119001 [Paramecium tetraurelia]CAK88151.1 unnamed protein product [Paramecium tetraurelia]|eukprot:XP_001455548.1 hypothetical protein (macronuclear) [Paramecium tetraurelia strain d4-2]
MICNIIDIAFSSTPQKGRISQRNTTASPASSSDSSFDSKYMPKLQIPRPQLSSEERFEASLCAFDFKLLMPDEGSLQNQKLLFQELIEMKFLFDCDEKLLYQKMNTLYYNLDICEENILYDDRTTLMLKNIPKYMRPSDLRNLLNKDFKSQFDFLYLPSDNNVIINQSDKNEGNLGYAFVNFISPEIVLRFFKKYNNNKWSINDKVDQDINYKSKFVN